MSKGKASKTKKRKINSPGASTQGTQNLDVSDTPPKLTCGCCKLIIDVEENDYEPLKCSICQSSFHDECLSFNTDIADVLRGIVDDVGWSCRSCLQRARTTITNPSLPCPTSSNASITNQSVAKLQNDVSDLRGYLSIMHDEITSMRNAMTRMVFSEPTSNAHVEHVGESHSLPSETTAVPSYAFMASRSSQRHQPGTIIQHPASSAPATTPPVNTESLLRSVCHELKDKERRKRNVIVSGLEPDHRVNDITLFANLCSIFL